MRKIDYIAYDNFFVDYIKYPHTKETYELFLKGLDSVEVVSDEDYLSGVLFKEDGTYAEWYIDGEIVYKKIQDDTEMSISIEELNMLIIEELALEVNLNLSELSVFSISNPEELIRVDYLITKSGIEMKYEGILLPEDMTEEEAIQELSQATVCLKGMTFEEITENLILFIEEYLDDFLDVDYSEGFSKVYKL